MAADRNAVGVLDEVQSFFVRVGLSTIQTTGKSFLGILVFVRGSRMTS